ncbi:EamA family transporter [Candidatus Daviesbacteria bacterium]|nr:EamA family transporter [Candidatus Daviesbacteria bacterium]
MFDWKILAIATPLLFVIYQTLSKFLPKDVSVFLVNAYASFIGFLIMLAFHLLTSSDKSLILGAKYLPIAFGIGALIGVGNYGIIKAYTLGAPQSLFTIIFYITLIIYGILFGVLIWHEKLNMFQIVGMIMAIAGIFITVYFKK